MVNGQIFSKNVRAYLFNDEIMDEIKNFYKFFTDGFETCHFILVSLCAVYADNNF